jgi:DNA ligase-1
MLYSRVAYALKQISEAPRKDKVVLTSEVLAKTSPDLLCPTVRLLLGELWPAWKNREMGTGPEAISAALGEVSEEDILRLRNDLGEMGAVAEEALKHKVQRPLSDEPLEAVFVYERLRRISDLEGPESLHRKRAVLRGLLIDATPLEGKYIVRTAMRSVQAGLGPQAMISAISMVFGCDYDDLLRAYSFLPELGLVAEAARRQRLAEIRIHPSCPVRPMIIPAGDAVIPGACLPRFAGLRVQVHKVLDETYIFSSRYRDITPSLDGLAQELGCLKGNSIIDADLIGFADSKRLCQAEMVRFINRGRLSRKSRIVPSLVAYDLIYLDGEDLTSHPYKERRSMLLGLLGEPKSLPFRGISAAEERILDDADLVRDYCRSVISMGFCGLITRGLEGLYQPGARSSCDAFIGGEESVAGAVVSAEFGRGKKEKLLSKYLVALRKGDDLVPVGWVSEGLKASEVRALSDHLHGIALAVRPEGVDVRPHVTLALKIRGVRRSGDEYRLVWPRIAEMRFDAAPEDVDGIERIERLCTR